MSEKEARGFTNLWHVFKHSFKVKFVENMPSVWGNNRLVERHGSKSPPCK